MSVLIKVCGCRGSFPRADSSFSQYGFSTTCIAVKYNDLGIIIDAGTGILNALNFLKDCQKVFLLFTHFHYDHIQGLLSVSPLFFEKTNTTVVTFGEIEGRELFKKFFSPPFWPVDPFSDTASFLHFNAEKEIELSNSFKVIAVPSNHPNCTNSLIVTLNEKKLGFLFDYEHSDNDERLLSSFSNCQILFYDGMFDTSNYDKHKGWGHSTWQKGIETADKLSCSRLLITHHSPYENDESLSKREKAAQRTRENTLFAKEGMVINLD